MSAKQMQIPIGEDFNLSKALELTKERFSNEGYNATATVFSPQCGKMTINKDMDGIKQYMGMGVECEANFTIMNGIVLSVSIESTWSNKIIALAVGWILCWVPFVTGCIGCSNQNKLPRKIEDVLKGVIVTLNNQA